VNPLGIILFSPLLVLVWGWLRARDAEPSTPVKILIGMIFTVASFGVMVGAALVAGETGKVSPAWLVSSYLLIAIAEISLSPMGLSLVSKVAPLRVRGVMMGGWFVATAIGNKLTAIGVYWSIWKQSSFFIILAAMALAMAVVLTLLLRPLKKAMPGV